MRVHVCWCGGAGGLGRGLLGRGAGGAGGPSPLIAVQPPTKLYFRQTLETPEPLNKYIFYDITPKGKKRYLPGMSTVDDMLQYDTCQRTYHWKCLTDLNACSHTARQAAENSEDWHCPAKTDLT